MTSREDRKAPEYACSDGASKDQVARISGDASDSELAQRGGTRFLCKVLTASGAIVSFAVAVKGEVPACPQPLRLACFTVLYVSEWQSPLLKWGPRECLKTESKDTATASPPTSNSHARTETCGGLRGEALPVFKKKLGRSFLQFPSFHHLSS